MGHNNAKELYISIEFYYYSQHDASAWIHYSDVIMTTMACQITSRTVVYSFIQTQIKENILAPRYWPLCGEFTGHRWILRTKGQ